MRRALNLQPQNQLALALAEIDRLKAIMTRITDGREITFIPGDDPGAGNIPPVEVSEHVLYGGKHTRAFQVTAAAGISLVVTIQQGQAWIGGTFFAPAELTLLMTDATTNFVFVNAAGAVATNVVSFPEDSIPLAEVVTAGGDITAVNDRRSYLLPGASAGGSPHDADQIIDDDGDTRVEVEQAVDEDIIRLTVAGNETLLVDSTGLGQIGGSATLALQMAGANPRLLMDANDILAYDRAADLWTFSINNVLQLSISAAGQVSIPTTGELAGILLGGDVQLFRAAADVLALAAGDNLHLLQGYIQLEDMAAPAIPAFGDMRFFARVAGNRIQLIGLGPTGEECIICDVSNLPSAPNTLTRNWIG